MKGTLLSAHEHRPTVRALPATSRTTGLAVVIGAALVLHAAALGGVPWGWPEPAPAPGVVAMMQVRVIEADVAQAAPLGADAGLPFAALAANALPAPSIAVERASLPPELRRTAVLRTPTPRAPLATAAGAIAAAAAAPASPASPATRLDEAPAAAPLFAAAASVQMLALNAPAAAPESTPGDEPVPHYRTRLPPTATLRYEMSRGMLTGTGELAWRPQADRYELTLKGSVGGVAVLTQVSSGNFDAAGVAPLRFTDQRLRRGTVAANFQRAAGKATFSGPTTEVPLQPGAQDRLSWMVQLAAVVAADPKHREPGAKVTMQVIGAHGEAGPWTFRCIGPETVESRSGAINALKFVREPREPYDTTVQVWLDPQRHDLPVRATQKNGPSDDGFELRLQEMVVGH